MLKEGGMGIMKTKIEVTPEKVDQLMADLRATKDEPVEVGSRLDFIKKLEDQYRNKLAAKQEFAKFLHVAKESWQAFVKPRQLAVAASTSSKPIQTIWKLESPDGSFRVVATQMSNGDLEFTLASNQLELNGVRLYSRHLEHYFFLERESRTEVRATVARSRFQQNSEHLFDFELQN
jgi:hypothetical protein